MEQGVLPQFTLIAESVELTEELKKAINIVKYNVGEYNALEYPTEEDKRKLDEYVDDFNYSQRRNAVKNTCSDLSELLELYVYKHKYTKIKLGCHSSNKKLCIEFETGVLSFEDFAKVHTELFKQYKKLEAVMSSLCYQTYENLLCEINVEKLFRYLGKFLESTKNPYQYHYFLLKSDAREDYASYDKIRCALSNIVKDFFAEMPIPAFVYSDVYTFVALVSASRSMKHFMNWLVGQVTNTFQAEKGMQQPAYREVYLSRHIAWCVHEHKRKCRELDIECHSSVSCPFYEEDSNKRQGRETALK